MSYNKYFFQLFSRVPPCAYYTPTISQALASIYIVFHMNNRPWLMTKPNNAHPLYSLRGLSSARATTTAIKKKGKRGLTK